MNEPVLAIMAPFATAVAIVFLVLTYQYLKLRAIGRSPKVDQGNVKEIPGTSQLAERAARMEQRLANLEEILRGHDGR